VSGNSQQAKNYFVTALK